MKPLLLTVAFIICAISCKQEDFVIPIPTISSFTPTSGQVGALVTISGEALQYTQSVMFGSKNAYFQIKSGRVEAVVPDGATSGVITVASTSGSSKSSTEFEFVATPAAPTPKILSFAPAEGIVGLSVEITGENLGTVTKVMFNGISTYFLQTNNVVDAIVPANATTGKITVVTENGPAESATSFTVNATKAPPQIIEVTPGDNPVKWPLLIEGQNLDNIEKITFGGVEAQVDSNSTNILTTWVPEGVTPGTALLTLTNKYGVSNSFLYTVRQRPPANTPPPPDRYYFRRKAKYPPLVQNNWVNEADGSHSLQLNDNGTGDEFLNGLDFPIVDIQLNAADKTIIVKVKRGTDVNFEDIIETYTGEYQAYGNPDDTDPEFQRILFITESGRQFLVKTKVR
jgi:hypothetical protein